MTSPGPMSSDSEARRRRSSVTPMDVGRPAEVTSGGGAETGSPIEVTPKTSSSQDIPRGKHSPRAASIQTPATAAPHGRERSDAQRIERGDADDGTGSGEGQTLRGRDADAQPRVRARAQADCKDLDVDAGSGPHGSSSASASAGSRAACGRLPSPLAEASTTPSRANATLPSRVAVSRARTIIPGRCKDILPISRAPAPRTLDGRSAPRHCRHATSGSADAGDEAVPRRQAPVSRRHPVLPDGRLLRDVLRGRARHRARARADAHVAVEGQRRRRDPDVRRALSRARRLPRPPGPQGLPRRHLRAGRGPEEGQGRRQARGRPRGLPRHAARRQLPRGARAGVSHEHHAGPGRPAGRGADRPDHGRVQHDGVHRRRDAGRRSKTSCACFGRASWSWPRARTWRPCPRPRASACRSRASSHGSSIATARAARWSSSSDARARRLRPGRPRRGHRRGRRAGRVPARQPEGRPRARPLHQLPPAGRAPADRPGDAEAPRDPGRQRRRAHRIAARRDRPDDHANGRPSAALVAGAPAGRARSDPRSPRRGRGDRLPRGRAREAARRAQVRARPRAARGAGGAGRGGAARPGRAQAVARRGAPRAHGARRPAGAAGGQPGRRRSTTCRRCGRRSSRRWSTSPARWPATAA